MSYRVLSRETVALEPPGPVVRPASSLARPSARGKFLFVGSEKFYVRGVTYGTFRPDESGSEFPRPVAVRRDFELMARSGINTVRTYTAPPRWVLDAAQAQGLRVLVGLAGERSAGYLCDGRLPPVEEWLEPALGACAGHPAVLGYAVANEIPAPTVRWLGARRVERYLERLCTLVRRADPGSLVTYVNYPTTEHLELPFVDFLGFNVYLESQEQFGAYLARLQNLAGDRPLLMTELGLDSLRNGEEAQSSSIAWQVRSAFASGCAGAFVYAWTDEWYRGGAEVDDWAFGLTRRDRSPKPALAAVQRAFRDVPFGPDSRWPRISVVVCSYNGARTLRDCLEGLRRLEYPDFEVIVVDDGSTDATAAIAHEHCFRVISTENRGLSNARNTGAAAATGEIVAYTDDDARPDPHWLHYLADAFRREDWAGVGGPNIAPAEDGWVAHCVANAPGGPLHVLVSDREAEHIPGCNMAFRKTALESVGGFDPRFRVAGDDVDLCWRLLDRGMKLGFHPGAMVWHHRRSSLRAYWRQQRGYGKAEALLEAKWPERYNEMGHATWTGRLYGAGPTRALSWRRSRIYQGVWGLAPFQSLYEKSAGTLASLTLMPEWYLVVLTLGALSLGGFAWRPLGYALPAFAGALAVPILQAWRSTRSASFPGPPRTWRERLGRRPLTAFLHLAQPAGRLIGRLRHGLTPWRRGPARGWSMPVGRTLRTWSENPSSSWQRLESVEAALRASGGVVRRGGDFDRWDLELRGGLLGAGRMRMAVEEHGQGRQMVRMRLWTRCAPGAVTLAAFLTLAAIGSALAGAPAAALGIGGGAAALAVWMARDCGFAMAGLRRAAAEAGSEPR